jgi:serine/threonine protein kinase
MWMKRLNTAAKIRRVSDDYDISDTLLGQGSYGKVLKGKNKATGESVAIKQVNKKGLQSEEIVLQMNEIDILRASSHPHVIRLLDFYEDSRQFSIVLEFLDGRDLFGYLESRLADEMHIRGIVGQLADGMDYLHNQLGVMHRDIKMENILIVH